MLVSVVICTYNRADLLEECLDELSKQTADPSEYEVIIIDNHSTDRTATVAESFARRHPSARYLMEPAQGLSHARNRGWRAAGGRYVAYIDDDCRVPPIWLGVAFEIIARIAPGAFGGPYSAFYKTVKPGWYRDSYFSEGNGDQAGALVHPQTLSGTNLFIRRSLLDRVGGFNTRLGMQGRAIGYGEETDLLLRVRQLDPAEIVYYDPRLWVEHLVTPTKMTLRWIARQRFAGGRSYRQVYRRDALPGAGKVRLFMRALRAVGGLALDALRGMVRRDRTRYPYIQNYLCELSFQRLHLLGMLYDQLTAGQRAETVR